MVGGRSLVVFVIVFLCLLADTAEARRSRRRGFRRFPQRSFRQPLFLPISDPTDHANPGTPIRQRPVVPPEDSGLMPEAAPGDFCGGYRNTAPPDAACTQALVPGIFFDRASQRCRQANAPNGCTQPPFDSLEACEEAVRSGRCNLSTSPDPKGSLTCSPGRNGYTVSFGEQNKSVTISKAGIVQETLSCNQRLQCFNALDAGLSAIVEMSPNLQRQTVRISRQNFAGNTELDVVTCSATARSRVSCDFIRLPEGTAGTLGGSNEINGFFFNRRTRQCQETRDLGSAVPRGPFGTRAECEQAVAAGQCS